jgi:hypothetical protein
VATLHNRGSIQSLTFISENTVTQSNGGKYRHAIYLQLGEFRNTPGKYMTVGRRHVEADSAER